MIGLFEHDQIAYDALCAIQTNPQKQFCWLFPSEHIFQTHLENIRRVSGFEPQNIRFLIYTRLMLMARIDVQDGKPDFIILNKILCCSAQLESIRVHWVALKTMQWNRLYGVLMHCYEQGASIIQMPKDCTTEQGGNLFNWVRTQKCRWKQGT